jgi:hypothetical protein
VSAGRAAVSKTAKVRASPRFSVAAIVSVLLHVAGIGVLLSLRSAGAGAQPFDTGTPPDIERRWSRIVEDGDGVGGPSRIVEVLNAPDAVRVILTPVAPDGSGRGLAWWSPTKGIWLAVDSLPSWSPGRRYHLWIVHRDGPAVHVGLLGVNPQGSGRILALNRDTAPPIDGPVMIVVTADPGGVTSRLTADWVLAGRGIPRIDKPDAEGRK